jgi:hypothetical protein
MARMPTRSSRGISPGAPVDRRQSPRLRVLSGKALAGGDDVAQELEQGPVLGAALVLDRPDFPQALGRGSGNPGLHHAVVDESASIDKLTLLDPARADQVLEAAAAFSNPGSDDLDRELIRNRLRELIHWHLSYGEGSSKRSGSVRGALTRRLRQPSDWPQLGPTRRK